MLALFGANKIHSEKELFRALEGKFIQLDDTIQTRSLLIDLDCILNKDDIVTITEQELQKARYNDPDILFKIGDIYFKDTDYHKSILWFYKAAVQDHAASQAQVALMYLRGEGVSIDYKKAMDWAMKAASKGNANGQYTIGRLYYHGLDVSEDCKKAMGWYLEAANNGSIEAMNEIGWMYKYGKGVTKNIPTTIEWYTKAAKQGHALAQCNLGGIYEKEVGFQDLQKAINWYQMALDNNHDYAQDMVTRLNQQGYYAKKEVKGILTTSSIKDTKHLTTIKVENNTIKDFDATTNINNDQSQSFAVNKIDLQITSLIENKMKTIEEMFQSKMRLMEVNMNNLKIEIVALKQEKREQRDEIKRLRSQLAKMEERIEDDTNNDLNYDSPDNESNHVN